MSLTRKETLFVFVLAALTVLIVGCDEEELRRIAKEAADRQAQQNQEVVRLNREVAQGTRRLVEEDAASRKAMVAVNQQLQSERKELSVGWNQLETERKTIARQRRQESLVAVGMREGGAVLLAILALGLVCFVVRAARHDPVTTDELIDTLLLECGPGGACHEYFQPQHQDMRPEIRDGRSRQLLAVDDSQQKLNDKTEEHET